MYVVFEGLDTFAEKTEQILIGDFISYCIRCGIGVRIVPPLAFHLSPYLSLGLEMDQFIQNWWFSINKSSSTCTVFTVKKFCKKAEISSINSQLVSKHQLQEFHGDSFVSRHNKKVLPYIQTSENSKRNDRKTS